MAFKVIGRITEANLKKVPMASTAVVAGDLLEVLSGSTNWTETAATSKWYSRKAICMETGTLTSVLVDELNGSETVTALCVAGTGTTDDNGDQMVLTDKTHVNNTGTNSADDCVAFMQEGIIDTNTIVGRVLVGNGEITTAT